MSLPSILPLATFWDKIPFSSATELTLLTYRKKSMTGEGDFLTAELGDPKWTGKFQLSVSDPLEAKAAVALFNAIQMRDLSFFAYDKWNPYPAKDPLGTIVASSTVRVKSIGANNRSLALKGLPPSYVLTAGDRFSIAFGTGKQALFELSESVTSNALGDTTEVEIVPTLWVGIAVDQVVQLRKPIGKFKILDGSYSPGTKSADDMLAKGISFEIISTL